MYFDMRYNGGTYRNDEKTTVEETVGTWEATLGEAAAAQFQASNQATVLQIKREWFEQS